VTTRDLACLATNLNLLEVTEVNMGLGDWRAKALYRLGRDLRAAADTGHELPEETLKAARDFLGVLVGR